MILILRHALICRRQRARDRGHRTWGMAHGSCALPVMVPPVALVRAIIQRDHDTVDLTRLIENHQLTLMTLTERAHLPLLVHSAGLAMAWMAVPVRGAGDRKSVV